MKHLWALSSTLVLSTAVVLTGMAAGAAGSTATPAAAELSAYGTAAPTTVPAHGFFWQLTVPQDIVAGTFLSTGKGAHRASEGTRSDEQFFDISRTGGNDVPEAALRAYHRAERVMATADPDCRISWTMLAAIGRVESNHGRFGGSQLGSDGVSRPAIRGPRLDGAGPFAAIRDSDNGKLDLDRVWDRAVGQMQFLPETWRSVARDGDGDGRMDPQDIDDSALSSAVYLCGAGGSLADTAGMSRAAFRYNHSDYYVSLVLSFAAGYSSGVFALPSPPPPAAASTTAKPRTVAKPRPTQVRTPKQRKVTPVAPVRPSSPPRPTPHPAPKPKPSTPPTPAAPKLVTVTGTWSQCFDGFCLDNQLLDLGTGNRAAAANADYDGDATVETNGAEFTGLVGKRVTLTVERKPLGLAVYVINGHGFRNQDGSFAKMMAPSPTP